MQLPEDIFTDARLSTTARLILVDLHHAREQYGRDYFSRREIGKRVNREDSAVRRHLMRLEGLGKVKVRQVIGGSDGLCGYAIND